MTALVIMLIATTSLAIAASPAMAETYHKQTFCDNWLAPGGTCPPNYGKEGVAAYGHLEEEQGDSAGESRETCIDAYLQNGNLEWYYSSPSCMYYAGEKAVQYHGVTYGQPRAWNGGSVSHTVWGWQYYYTT